MIEVIVNPAQRLAAHKALTDLQAQNFIRPELEVYGRAVVVDAAIYPGTRSPKYARTGKLGRSILAPPVAGNSLEKHVQTAVRYGEFVFGEVTHYNPKGNQPYAWRFGWRRLRRIMERQMDLWIYSTESKAFKLWERP